MASRVLSKRRFLPFVKRMNDQYQAGWVHEDICRRLEKFSDDVRGKKSPRLMLLMPPRHGKALAVGTLIPTPSGMTPIQNLRPGDMVFGASGAPIKVLAVSEIWKDRELFEVSTDDGASVIADAEHEWTVRLCRKRPVFKTKTTQQLAARSSPRAPALGEYGAVQCPPAELPVPPYTFGVWLGDGCSQHATVTQGEQDYDIIRAAVEADGVRTSNRATVGTFGLLGMSAPLRFELGVLGNKHIPAQYMRGAVDQRLALLQGLIDTDGYVAPDGQVEFCSINRRLAHDVLDLVRSLGVKASMVLGRAALNGMDCGEKYRVMFYMKDAARLPRKAERCRNGVRSPHRFLSFRPAGRGDTVCIQVDAPDHQYLAGYGYMLTHNSELASRSFPAWHLGRFPDHEFIACSYNMDLAVDFSRKVKAILEDPSYQSIFPETKLDPDNRSAEKWVVHGKRGGYVAAGVGGGITGRGAHVLVIDDPIKAAEDADSSDNREKLWQWYLSTAYSRLAPGAGVLIIQTWWHDDDLAGRLQTMMRTGSEDRFVDQFDVVKYPAIAEADEYLNLATNLIEYDAPPEDPHTLLRLKGEALHPARYDLDKLLRIKAQNKGGRWWSALYQQNPVPDDGGYFEKAQFRRSLAPSHKKCNVFIAWDFAISERKHNDYTVGTVGIQDDDDVLHIVDQVRFRSGDAFFIVDSILTLASKWHNPTLQLGFEDGQIYRSLEALLKKRMRERRVYPSITVLKPLTDKLTRARALQGRMQQGMVSFTTQGDWYDSCRQEMLRFPAGAHDDQVDSLAYVASMAVGREPPSKPRQQKDTSWRDKLSFSSSSSFMAA